MKSSQEYKKRSRMAFICRRFSKNKLAMMGLALVILLVLLALSADLFFDYHDDVVLQNVKERLQHPGMNPAHLLGTDQYGRDILARVIYGARVSLFISVIVITISTVLGVLFGGLAAYCGGVVDNIIMRVLFHTIHTDGNLYRGFFGRGNPKSGDGLHHWGHTWICTYFPQCNHAHKEPGIHRSRKGKRVIRDTYIF